MQPKKLFGILKEYMPIRLKYHQQGDKVYLITDIENTMVFLTDVSFAVHVKEGFLEKSILLLLGRPLQSQLTAICDQVVNSHPISRLTYILKYNVRSIIWYQREN